MDIPLSDSVSLGPIRLSDRSAYVTHLADRAIYDQTLRIPHPYTLEHADEWIALSEVINRQAGRPVNFSLRERGQLIGGAGFNDYQPGSHKAEIGYWLARPWWGRGIMPLAVDRIVQLGFREMGLQRITATLFDGNDRSRRVVEKCGFVYEGYLKNYYLKDGRLIHGRLYAKFP